MAAFTLIHGSTQNSTAWTDVAQRLRAHGHTVIAPDLPKNEPSWSVSRYAEFIGESLPASRPHLIVAHSFCGVFLPLLAPHADLLVFEAAVVPAPGRSVYDQFVEDRSMFCEEWIAAGARWFDTAQQPALAREFLFHDCKADALPAALATIELFDTRNLVMEPNPVERWPSSPSVSIICSDDRALSPAWSRTVARERRGMVPIELKAGHCPHTSRPVDIADILQTLAHTDADLTVDAMREGSDYTIRRGTAEDEPLLWEMLYHSLHVDEGQQPFPRDVVRDPHLARYVQGWGRSGDLAFIAIDADGQPIGAVWSRVGSDADKGFAYIDDQTPELAIALLPAYRGKGVGTALLKRLLAAGRTMYPAFSLSVSPQNPARHLYERLGFRVTDVRNGHPIMVVRFA